MENIIYFIGGVSLTCLLLGWRIGLSATFLFWSALFGMVLIVFSMGWSELEQRQFIFRATPYFYWYVWVIWGIGIIYRLAHFKMFWNSMKESFEQRKKIRVIRNTIIK